MATTPPTNCPPCRGWRAATLVCNCGCHHGADGDCDRCGTRGMVDAAERVAEAWGDAGEIRCRLDDFGESLRDCDARIVDAAGIDRRADDVIVHDQSEPLRGALAALRNASDLVDLVRALCHLTGALNANRTTLAPDTFERIEAAIDDALADALAEGG